MKLIRKKKKKRPNIGTLYKKKEKKIVVFQA